jgi:UDP-glucose 4-epimerase
MEVLVRGQDFLFNLAGQTSHLDSMLDPYTDLEINCRSQLSILEACRRVNPEVKVILASTRQIYGIPRYLPVDEKHLLYPVDVNGINKMAGEWYHIVYHNVYGIRAVALRLTNTYGPRMRVKDARQTFLGIWLRRIIEEEPLEIFGDGSQIRDFNFIEDVLDALLLSASQEHSNGKVFNLGADDPLSLKELAELLIQLRGRGRYRLVPFPQDRKAIDIGDYFASYQFIQQQLNWKPRTSLPEGLASTLNYYLQNLAHYL